MCLVSSTVVSCHVCWSILDELPATPDVIVIDGYVWLDVDRSREIDVMQV